MGKSYLGGQVVSALTPVEWRVTTGVQPYQAILAFNVKQREAVEALIGSPTTLTIGAVDGEVITVEQVYVLREVPTKWPFTIAYLVADRRWKWPRILVVRDYNITRHTGDRILVGPNEENVPIESAQAIDTFRYRRSSLKDEKTRYTARTMLEDICEAVDPGAWTIESTSIQADGTTGAVSIQNVMLRDGGDAAMSRALGNAPGTEVRVDLTGRVVIFDATDTGSAARALRDGGGPAGEPGDIAKWISRRALRPKRVHVHFVREIELRFDFEESETAYAQDRSTCYCENVVPLPDPWTDVNGKRLAQGTYVPVVTALAAWEASAVNDSGAKSESYSLATVRLFYAQGAAGLAKVWGAGTFDLTTTGSAAARASAIIQHYRRTFRVNQEIAERLREMRAVRVAILDKTTGTRAPAQAWSQYCVFGTKKGWLITSRRDPSIQGVAINKNDYPGASANLTDKIASAAIVSVVDPQLGIIRVSYPVGPYDLQESTVPCMIADSAGSTRVPGRNWTEADVRPIAFGGSVESAPGANGMYAQLASTFQIAFIVSGIPAAPNNARQCHRVTVEPGDVDAQLRTRFTSGEALGPDFDVFMDPQTCRARFGWKDTPTAQATVRNLLGFKNGDPTKAGLDPGAPLTGFVFVNGEDEIPANAKASAVAVWAAFVDGVEGDHVTHLRQFPVSGNVAHVSYSAGVDGAMLTTVSFSPSRPPMNPFALLPTEVRQTTLRIVRGDE